MSTDKHLLPYAWEICQAMEQQSGSPAVFFLPEVVKFLLHDFREVQGKLS